MYDDDREPEDQPGGRRALVMAWSALVAALLGVFVYVFVLAPSGATLDRYGGVTQTLSPPPARTAQADPGSAATDGGDTVRHSLPAPEASEPPGEPDTGAEPALSESLLLPEPDSLQDGQAATSPDDGSADDGSADTGADKQPPEPDTTAADDSDSRPPTEQAGRDAGGTGPETANAESDTAGGDERQPARPGRKPQQTARAPAEADDGGPDADATASTSERTGQRDLAAWQRYARVLNPPDGVPRIAVILRGLGLSTGGTEAAIKRLPPEVSLAFTPYARRAADWTLRARSRGHEVLIDLPMEPESFPARDPGPKALMATLPTPVNMQRLEWALDQGREIVGVVAQMGSRFLNNPDVTGPVMQRLKQLGLLYIDNGELRDNAALQAARRIELPHAVNDRTLDGGQVSRPAIEARLVEAERIAQQDGLAVVLAHPYPVTIDLLVDWADDLGDRGFVLVPITTAVAPSVGTESASLR